MAASAAGGGVEQGIDRRAAMVHGGSLGKTDAVVTGLAMENRVEIARCDECEMSFLRFGGRQKQGKEPKPQ